MFERIKGIFKRKTETLPVEIPKITAEEATIENVKAKMDLLLTQLDSLRTQYEALNERVQTIERILKELYAMAKS